MKSWPQCIKRWKSLPMTFANIKKNYAVVTTRLLAAIHLMSESPENSEKNSAVVVATFMPKKISGESTATIFSTLILAMILKDSKFLFPLNFITEFKNHYNVGKPIRTKIYCVKN